MHIEKLGQIFESFNQITVPSYQRAYSWEEKQLEQFVNDLIEINDKGGYYYGHFIFEKTNNNWEVIDGQQRLTTFVLFNIICDIKLSQKSNEIDQFETVNYDQNNFLLIKKNAYLGIDLLSGIEENEKTKSLQKIIEALNFFDRKFIDGTLKLEKITEYLKTLKESLISVHLANDKRIAVQIFELHNTRGVDLNLIEKVKSKLMKAVFIHSIDSNENLVINNIQQIFAEIYKIEEKLGVSNLLGKISLEEIIFRSLRMIDDGSKLNPIEKHVYSQPSSNNRTESILNYLDQQILDRNNDSSKVLEYCQEVTFRFCEIIKFIIQELPEIDTDNRLIGDVLILDRPLSLQFFILIHQKFPNEFKNFLLVLENIFLWEKLLFIRDFHSHYYGLKYGDDFEDLFFYLAKISSTNEINEVLVKFLKTGFRPDKMDKDLSIIVNEFLTNHKSNILTNAYHFWKEKMAYTIYKYEINQGVAVNLLREVHFKGRSIEHILPSEWQWDWIAEYDLNNISEKGKQFNEKIQKEINGIGNLLLITESENSKLSNKHPKEKVYESCIGGTYSKHNNGELEWNLHEKWSEIIENRGTNIYNFMMNYFIGI